MGMGDIRSLLRHVLSTYFVLLGKGQTMTFREWIHSRRLSARLGVPALVGLLCAVWGSPQRATANFLVAMIGFALVKEILDWIWEKSHAQKN
jgi:hypothetical protein